MIKRKACEGHPTITEGNMEECVYCGQRVIWDLIDHPFFGFSSSCPDNPALEPTNTTEPLHK